MISNKEMYDKFMADIQKGIDEVDKKVKQKAETTLQTVYDNYRKTLNEKIERELRVAESHRASGNEVAARHHEMMAGIYRSILEIDLGNPKMIITAIALASFAMHTGLLPVKAPYLAAVLQPIRMNSN